MNIKRIAEQYRRQVTLTGRRAEVYVQDVLFEGYDCYGDIDDACRYLRQWYLKLEKALGGGRDLKSLRLSWETIKRMKRVFRGNKHRELSGSDIKRLQNLSGTASRQFGRFHNKLPKLIEKSLRRSVRESGIF